MQQHSTQPEDGKMYMQLHPVAFQSGTLQGIQAKLGYPEKRSLCHLHGI